MSNHESHSQAHHPASYYIRIYWILAVLLVVSIAGPLTAHHFGSAAHTIVLVTGFGIAFVKAYMVAAKFMHLNVERRMIWWLLITSLAVCLVLFFGLAPDIKNGNGHHWVNDKVFVINIDPVHDCHPGSADYRFDDVKQRNLEEISNGGGAAHH
jgi:caa(3)-type oxidase subunit IV